MAGHLKIQKYKKQDIQFAKFMLFDSKRVDLYQMLASFLENGVGEVEALENLWMLYSRDGRKPTEAIAVALGCWRDIKLKGRPLTDAMRGWVPEQERMIIMAGEGSGKMVESLRRCAKNVKDNGKISSAIKKALAYPLFLFAGCAGLLTFYTFSVIPTYAAILPMEKWRGAAATLAFVSYGIRNYWWLMLLISGAIIAAFIYSLPRWTSRMGGLRKFLDKLPPYSLYREQQGASFVTSVGALLEGGIPLQDAMHLVSAFGGSWFKQRVMAAERIRSHGHDLGSALKATGFNFPSEEIIIKIACYAKASSLEKSLVSIGEEMVTTGVESMEAKAGIIQFLGMLAATIMLLWITFALFDVSTQIRAAIT